MGGLRVFGCEQGVGKLANAKLAAGLGQGQRAEAGFFAVDVKECCVFRRVLMRGLSHGRLFFCLFGELMIFAFFHGTNA